MYPRRHFVGRRASVVGMTIGATARWVEGKEMQDRMRMEVGAGLEEKGVGVAQVAVLAQAR